MTSRNGGTLEQVAEVVAVGVDLEFLQSRNILRITCFSQARGVAFRIIVVPLIQRRAERYGICFSPSSRLIHFRSASPQKCRSAQSNWLFSLVAISGCACLYSMKGRSAVRTLAPKAIANGEPRDRICAVIEKETNDLGLPAEQDISEGNGLDIRTVSKQQLHEIKPSHRNCVG